MNIPAVSIENLGFTYPGHSGVHFSKLFLQINAGERFGLFGPNGAGKTTLMSCMTGLLPDYTGSIRLMGQEVRHNKKVRSLMGLVPQDFSFYHELSPVENLAFFGAWAGLTRQRVKEKTTELMNVLGLSGVQNKPVEQFSGGMKRRVNLAIAVLHEPPVLFLDEPTVGVDVQTRHAIIGYLKTLNTNGTTLIYTSHQLKEAEELCTKIALIDDSEIIAHDTLEHLMIEHKEEGLEGLFLNLTGKSYRDADV